MSTSTVHDLDTAARRIASIWRRRPVAGIILGTGLGRFVDRFDLDGSIAFADLPCLCPATASGHVGCVHVGCLDDLPVLIFQGRIHAYEGHDGEALSRPIELLARLGVRCLVTSNASGGINPRFAPGDLMVIEQCIDLLDGNPVTVLHRFWSESRRSRTAASDCSLGPLALSTFSTAEQLEVPLTSGTYAAVIGPNYETRAEYRLLRQLNIDAVGMSTAPELRVARRHGIDTVAISTITNCCDPDHLQSTSGEQVIAVAETALDRFATLVRGLLHAHFHTSAPVCRGGSVKG